MKRTKIKNTGFQDNFDVKITFFEINENNEKIKKQGEIIKNIYFKCFIDPSTCKYGLLFKYIETKHNFNQDLIDYSNDLFNTLNIENLHEFIGTFNEMIRYENIFDISIRSLNEKYEIVVKLESVEVVIEILEKMDGLQILELKVYAFQQFIRNVLSVQLKASLSAKIKQNEGNARSDRKNVIYSNLLGLLENKSLFTNNFINAKIKLKRGKKEDCNQEYLLKGKVIESLKYLINNIKSYEPNLEAEIRLKFEDIEKESIKINTEIDNLNKKYYVLKKIFRQLKEKIDLSKIKIEMEREIELSKQNSADIIKSISNALALFNEVVY